MNNQSNSDYDKDLSWSENPDNFPFDADAQEGGNKKDVFTTLIKTFSMMILALALLVFVGIAWFTMNKNVGTNSMGVKISTDLFTIEPVRSSGYHVGIFDDPTLSGTNGTYVADVLSNRASITNEVMTWTITDDRLIPDGSGTRVEKGYNIGNGPAEGEESGIRPGSSGIIQFVIKPNQPTAAEFTFYVYSYTGGYDSHGDEDKSTIQLITSGNSGTSGTSAESIIASKLLNGHILLFSDIDNGKYEGLIDSDAEFKRLMTRTYSVETTVNIYWVWPETLAEILLDDNNPNMRGKTNICTATGKREVIALFKTHPEWFLLDPTNLNRDWSSTISPSATDEAVVDLINSNYALYSSFYNEADQCIGTHVSYILLDLTAEGTSASGSGTESGATPSGSG